MKKFSLFLGIILFLIFLRPLAGNTQEASDTESSSSSTSSMGMADACKQDINRALSRERFLYEGVLFGVRPAAKLPNGSTRVDEEGRTWLKNDDDKWVSAEQSPKNDKEMDDATAHDHLPPLSSSSSSSSQAAGVRPGILETQEALTSDLLPPILQSFRAFQCRVTAVCKAASLAVQWPAGDESIQERGKDEPTTALDNDFLSVDITGCLDLEVHLPRSCQPTPRTTFLKSYMDAAVVRTYCQPTAQSLLQYEEAQLSFLAHYDAAHRTLRQFAGYLEPFLASVRFPFLSPIRQDAQFFNTWNRIPCFLPFCAQDF